MQRIVVLNPKGGSGKTTIAINLAACYAVHGERPALMDLDPQGSSVRWLRKRSADLSAIHGIAAFERSPTVTRSWQMRVPGECQTVVVDTPAAVDPHSLPELTRGADAVLVPVTPSEIDIHATAKCIADLLLVAKIRRSEKRIGIIANRVRSNTRVWQSLTRFLSSLDIPLIAALRDSQNYLRSAEIGVGVCEMPFWQVQHDLPHWQEIMSWLAARRRADTASEAAPANVMTMNGTSPAIERLKVAPLASLASATGRELDASA